MSSIEEIAYKVLDRSNREDCIELLHTHPESVTLYKCELNTAILFFNQIIENSDVLMHYQDYVPNILDLLSANRKLSTVSQINSKVAKIPKDTLKEIAQNALTNQLLSDLKCKPHILMPHTLIDVYHHVESIIHFSQANAPIKNAITELLAILALDGVHTNSFQSMRHEIKTHTKTRFHKKLYQLTKRI